MAANEDVLDGLSTHPCAIVFESAGSIDSVVNEAKKLAKDDDAIVAVRDDLQIEKRLLPAYINAYLRHREKSMHSNSLSIETLLFIAGNMNIGNAVKKVAANKRRFLLFSSSRELADILARKCKLKKISEKRLVLNEEIASDVAMTAIKDDK